MQIKIGNTLRRAKGIRIWKWLGIDDMREKFSKLEWHYVTERVCVCAFVCSYWWCWVLICYRTDRTHSQWHCVEPNEQKPSTGSIDWNRATSKYWKTHFYCQIVPFFLFKRAKVLSFEKCSNQILPLPGLFTIRSLLFNINSTEHCSIRNVNRQAFWVCVCHSNCVHSRYNVMK